MSLPNCKCTGALLFGLLCLLSTACRQEPETPTGSTGTLPNWSKYHYVRKTIECEESAIRNPWELDAPPAVKRSPDPTPPTSFQILTLSGSCQVMMIVDRKGQVQEVVVMSASNPDIAKSCAQAARYWEFTPATVKGEPACFRFYHKFQVRWN